MPRAPKTSRQQGLEPSGSATRKVRKAQVFLSESCNEAFYGAVNTSVAGTCRFLVSGVTEQSRLVLFVSGTASQREGLAKAWPEPAGDVQEAHPGALRGEAIWWLFSSYHGFVFAAPPQLQRQI